MKAIGRMVAGLVLWAVAFTVLYSLHGVGCERGWAETQLLGLSLHRAVLLAVWILGMAAGLALALAVDWRRERMTERVGYWIAWAGTVSIFASGLPVAVLPDCL
ncbi:MAG: hypothetical protein GX644_04185 [Limnobacter sp.]|nr:hypothetical protein [Limnobacter sp.]